MPSINIHCDILHEVLEFFMKFTAKESYIEIEMCLDEDIFKIIMGFFFFLNPIVFYYQQFPYFISPPLQLQVYSLKNVAKNHLILCYSS